MNILQAKIFQSQIIVQAKFTNSILKLQLQNNKQKQLKMQLKNKQK